MTYLVGDIGGTNTRLALAGPEGVHQETILRARNDDFDSFDAVLAHFLATQRTGHLDGICIAIAGPVQAGEGRLTNRNWALSAAGFGVQSGAARAELINDLAALGYALPRITPEHIFGTRVAPTNGQSLVTGLGTGFNVSLTKQTRHGDTLVIEAELGHAEVPHSIGQLMQDALGAEAAPLKTVEDLFCGPGLERLHSLLSGATLDGGSIIAAYEANDEAATATVELFTKALAYLTRALIHQYLPRDGIVFAGSAARGVLGSRALPLFVETLESEGPGIVAPATIPLSVITDDAAALQGCLQHLVQTAR
ncbi:glucokinase [Shimia sp.]|uniref:glucokinase n=1 Tax=Shimia sp. TaxID=1954381 RepID=UPI003BABA85E